MKKQTWGGLFRWEFEQYLSTPVLALIIASAIISVLIQTLSSVDPTISYLNLYAASSNVILFLTVISAALFSRSFGGGIGKGEVKLLLSYPNKRWQIFTAKFLSLFIVIFPIYFISYYLHVYLDALNIFDPMIFISTLLILIQLLLVSSIATCISMVVKNDIMAILATILLFLGIESIASAQNILSAKGRFFMLFQFFGAEFHGSPPFGSTTVVSSNDVISIIVLPIFISVILLLLSFLYFNRFLEVD